MAPATAWQRAECRDTHRGGAPGSATSASVAAARRPPTARGLVLLAVVIATLRASAAAAEGAPAHLVLPLIATLALGRSVLETHVGGATPVQLLAARRSVPTRASLLPSFLSIPDLYSVDVTERDPRRFADPVDRDKWASLNLLPANLSRGRSLSLVYDTESLPALQDSSQLFRLQFEVKF